MSNAIADLFADADYCRDEIVRIRESIGTTAATQATFDACSKTLAFMYLHCPENLQNIVLSQLTELNRREAYFQLRAKKY